MEVWFNPSCSKGRVTMSEPLARELDLRDLDRDGATPTEVAAATHATAGEP